MYPQSEGEMNIDKLGRITFEKNPNYYIDIKLTKLPEESFYTVNVHILKPIGQLEVSEISFKFPYSEVGRSDATQKYLVERTIIDKALSRI